MRENLGGRGKIDKNECWEFRKWIQDISSNGIYKKDGKLNIHETKFENIEFELLGNYRLKKAEHEKLYKNNCGFVLNQRSLLFCT
ncbi:hypothetical protein JCM19274_1511 [Algibacter lectus]|uniref:Uncharacterized protein n=1 Tax=Algibacter lectus TaxID=221126 RepID=A0A090WUS8_9FLAO|nr:hypothetical protein JCM19274_1511 [Algibacter lectus]